MQHNVSTCRQRRTPLIIQKNLRKLGYGWEPPDLPLGVYSIRRAMRSYVRRWINEWDLMRLYPGVEVATEEQELHASYAEDGALEQPPEVSEGQSYWNTVRDSDAGPLS